VDKVYATDDMAQHMLMKSWCSPWNTYLTACLRPRNVMLT